MKRIQIVLFAISEKHLNYTVSSLLRQKLKKENIRIIFVDTVNTEGVKNGYDELCTMFECEYIHASGGVSEGLSKAAAIMEDAPFVFCVSGTEYSENAIIAEAEKIDEGQSIVSIHPYIVVHLSSRLAEKLVEKTDDYLHEKLEEGFVRFDEHIASMHLSMDAYMFSSDFVKYVREFEASDEECLKRLLLRMLSCNEGFWFVSGEKATMYNAQQVENPDYTAMKEKWWYTSYLDRTLTPFINSLRDQGKLIEAIQYSLTSMILSRFRANYEEKNLGVLTGREEIEELYNATGRALGSIKNEVILRWCDDNRWDGRGQDKKVKFHRAMAFRILGFKAEQMGGSVDITNDKHYIYVSTPGENPTQVCRASQETIDVTVINYENGKLVIDAVFSAGDVLGSNYDLWAECAGQRIEVESSPVYPLIKCFGQTIAHRQPVRLSFDASVGTSLGFYFCIDDHIKHSLKLTFNAAFSRLVTDKKNAYWIFTKGRYLCCSESRTLLIKKISPVSHIGKEIKALFSIFVSGVSFSIGNTYKV